MNPSSACVDGATTFQEQPHSSVGVLNRDHPRDGDAATTTTPPFVVSTSLCSLLAQGHRMEATRNGRGTNDIMITSLPQQQVLDLTMQEDEDDDLFFLATAMPPRNTQDHGRTVATTARNTEASSARDDILGLLDMALEIVADIDNQDQTNSPPPLGVTTFSSRINTAFSPSSSDPVFFLMNCNGGGNGNENEEKVQPHQDRRTHNTEQSRQ